VKDDSDDQNDGRMDRPVTDQAWRLDNLYYITDKSGRRVKFTMNPAQRALFDRCTTRM